MKTRLTAFLLVLSMLVPMTQLSALNKRTDDGSIVITNFEKPIVHNSTYLRVNGRASTHVAVLIDEKGHVNDWLPVRTNDRVLVKAIGRVIEKWEFEPHISEGEASWMFAEIEIKFKQGGVVSLNIGEAAAAKLKTIRDDYQLVVPYSELDSIPKPIEMNKPLIPSSIINPNEDKYVHFQFYIDEKGSVRMPIVKDREMNLEAAGVVLGSLMKWKFEPPTRKGKPVCTKVIAPFLYQPN